jgi:hypothetical protein
MNFADKLLAYAQVGHSFLFAIGFFALLFILIMYHRDMTSVEVTIMTGMVSVLGTLVTQQQTFFFARKNPSALPDPNATTTTTSTTTPTPDSGTGVVAQTTITPTPTQPEISK